MGSIAPAQAMMAVNKALHDIHEVRATGASDPKRLAELENSLKTAYSQLAEKSGAKVTNWQPSKEA